MLPNELGGKSHRAATTASSAGPSLAPPCLRSYMMAHGIDPRELIGDGWLGLTFDGRWRVQLRVMPDQRLMLSAVLMDVSRVRHEHLEDLLVALAQYAVGVMQNYEGGLALDTGAGRLSLHQTVPSDATLEQLETSLADFITLRSFWAGAITLETARHQIAEVH